QACLRCETLTRFIRVSSSFPIRLFLQLRQEFLEVFARAQAIESALFFQCFRVLEAFLDCLAEGCQGVIGIFLAQGDLLPGELLARWGDDSHECAPGAAKVKDMLWMRGVSLGALLNRVRSSRKQPGSPKNFPKRAVRAVQAKPVEVDLRRPVKSKPLML